MALRGPTCWQSDYVTPVLLVIHVYAMWLHNLCRLGGRQHKKKKTSGHKRHALYCVPNAQTTSKWLHVPYQLGGPCVGKVAKWLNSRIPGRSSQSRNEINLATSPMPPWGRPNGGGIHNQWHVAGPCAGKIATEPLPSWGSQKGGGNQSGYIRSAVLAAQASAKWLYGTYHLGGPKSSDQTEVST